MISCSCSAYESRSGPVLTRKIIINHYFIFFRNFFWVVLIEKSERGSSFHCCCPHPPTWRIDLAFPHVRLAGGGIGKGPDGFLEARFATNEPASWGLGTVCSSLPPQNNQFQSEPSSLPAAPEGPRPYALLQPWESRPLVHLANGDATHAS